MMKYTDSHEWIRKEETLATVGISRHARQELGEIVYVELPKVGQEVHAGAEIAVLESTKAAADIYAPVSGKVTKVNTALTENIALINDEPEGNGWLFEIEMHDATELDTLLDKAAYQSLIS